MIKKQKLFRKILQLGLNAPCFSFPRVQGSLHELIQYGISMLRLSQILPHKIGIQKAYSHHEPIPYGISMLV
jgi:hypothetical protein